MGLKDLFKKKRKDDPEERAARIARQRDEATVQIRVPSEPGATVQIAVPPDPDAAPPPTVAPPAPQSAPVVPPPVAPPSAPPQAGPPATLPSPPPSAPPSAPPPSAPPPPASSPQVAEAAPPAEARAGQQTTQFVSVPGFGRGRVTAVLAVVDGELEGQAFVLREGETKVGRLESCEVVLPSIKISREHAAIVFEDGAFRITPLSQQNPTLVNDEPTQGQALTDGDKLRMGASVFRFRTIEGS